ncbi:MAG: leucine-rich repeat domain-containing protein, partial [Spirochaetaceae bacterium]|nr:leucine-rich repeat domain-containing protein [Spirochaetaceae bacterium]
MKLRTGAKTGMAALALLFMMGLAACGGKKAEAEPGAGAADVKQAATDAKKAASGALSAFKKGDAAAIAASLKDKTAAELAALFESDYVSPGGDFGYDLNEAGDGIVIKNYTGKSSVLVIPHTIEGFPVVQVGQLESDERFWPNLGKSGEPLRALVIPEGVKIIALSGYERPHVGENLETIVFPSTLVKIEYISTFKKITSVDLSHCTGLTEVR